MTECGLDDAHYKLKIVENSLSCSLRLCLLTISYKDKSQAFELLSRMDEKKFFIVISEFTSKSSTPIKRSTQISNKRNLIEIRVLRQ